MPSPPVQDTPLKSRCSTRWGASRFRPGVAVPALGDLRVEGAAAELRHRRPRCTRSRSGLPRHRLQAARDRAHQGNGGQLEPCPSLRAQISASAAIGRPPGRIDRSQPPVHAGRVDGRMQLLSPPDRRWCWGSGLDRPFGCRPTWSVTKHLDAVPEETADGFMHRMLLACGDTLAQVGGRAAHGGEAIFCSAQLAPVPPSRARSEPTAVHADALVQETLLSSLNVAPPGWGSSGWSAGAPVQPPYG